MGRDPAARRRARSARGDGRRHGLPRALGDVDGRRRRHRLARPGCAGSRRARRGRRGVQPRRGTRRDRRLGTRRRRRRLAEGAHDAARPLGRDRVRIGLVTIGEGDEPALLLRLVAPARLARDGLDAVHPRRLARRCARRRPRDAPATRASRLRSHVMPLSAGRVGRGRRRWGSSSSRPTRIARRSLRRS